MRKPFEVGERVRVYGANTSSLKITGEITGFFRRPNYVWVRYNSSTSKTYHIKQLRRLKPRAKPAPTVEKRREVWITALKMIYLENGQDCEVINVWGMKPEKYPDAHHFVELKPGEAIVSREALAKAWKSVFTGAPLDSVAFIKISKALGLGEK